MPVVYVAPVSLLYQAARLLLPPERMCFVTGVPLLGGRLIVLTQLVPVESKSSSRVAVVANGVSIHRVHQRLLRMGLDIHGQFHSHPGRGPAALRPSPDDLLVAERWESGAAFLGAIFSECGRFVRFFNHRQHSEVLIHGHITPTHDSDCFELPDPDGDPVLSAAGQPLGLAHDRPPGEADVVVAAHNGASQDPDGRIWWPG